MRSNRRRKQPFSSTLDPSWILEGQDDPSIARSKAERPGQDGSKTGDGGLRARQVGDEAPKKSPDENQPSPSIKGKKKTRYAKQHSSDWLDDDMDASLSTAEPVRQPEEPPSKNTTNAPNPGFSRSVRPSIFRVSKPSHASPGYDAPAISPTVSPTYSPSNTIE